MWKGQILYPYYSKQVILANILQEKVEELCMNEWKKLIEQFEENGYKPQRYSEDCHVL